MLISKHIKYLYCYVFITQFYFIIHLFEFLRFLEKCWDGGGRFVKLWEDVCPTNAAPEWSVCPASDDDLTSWSMSETVTGGLWYSDETVSAKSMGDDRVNSRSSYSLLIRWGEMASPAEVEAEPPEPSELMKEPLSWQGRCGSAECVGVGGRSGQCSRLLDLINFFSFRVIQFPRLWKGRYTRRNQSITNHAEVNYTSHKCSC